LQASRHDPIRPAPTNRGQPPAYDRFDPDTPEEIVMIRQLFVAATVASLPLWAVRQVAKKFVN
jgi:hypothetical protein